MTTVWALIEFTDQQGVRHRPDGSSFELPSTSDADRHALARMLAYGMVTEQAPVVEGQSSGRTRRR